MWVLTDSPFGLFQLEVAHRGYTKPLVNIEALYISAVLCLVTAAAPTAWGQNFTFTISLNTNHDGWFVF